MSNEQQSSVDNGNETATVVEPPDYAAQAQVRAAEWKDRAKTRHKIVGIWTWHINLNPTAMSSMPYSKAGGQVQMPPRQDRNSKQPEPKNVHVDWRGPFATQAGALMVEITTDKGLKGYGLGGGGLAGALIIDRHIQYFTLERDPLDVEEIWDNLYHITSIYGRRGVVIYALSGIELALWDLCGKILDAPVYSLITDEPQLEIPAYATGVDVGYYVARGFTACKPGLRNGLAEGEEGFAKNLEIIREARQKIGPDIELMADIYLRWDVDYTLRFAEAAADVNLKWIEEAIALDDYAGMARLVREIDSTWIVSGEHEFTRYGFRELLRWKAAHMIQPDISWAGGFGECLKIANEAAAQGIPTWPHQGGTPWGLHLIACLPMPCRAETFGPSRKSPENELYRCLRPAPHDGFFTLSDSPGFGVEIDEKLLDAYTVDSL